MSTVIKKEDAHKLVDQLPPNATWEDLMHEIYVREAMKKGMNDSKEVRIRDQGEIRPAKMKVHWTETAEAHLDAIYAYIAQNSATYALHTVDKITKRSKQIGTLPMSGRKVPEYEFEQIREVFSGPYRIIYHIKSTSSQLFTEP